jgi:hypothetical protein
MKDTEHTRINNYVLQIGRYIKISDYKKKNQASFHLVTFAGEFKIRPTHPNDY